MKKEYPSYLQRTTLQVEGEWSNEENAFITEGLNKMRGRKNLAFQEVPLIRKSQIVKSKKDIESIFHSFTKLGGKK
jgi:hypothetical protein